MRTRPTVHRRRPAAHSRRTGRGADDDDCAAVAVDVAVGEDVGVPAGRQRAHRSRHPGRLLPECGGVPGSSDPRRGSCRVRRWANPGTEGRRNQRTYREANDHRRSPHDRARSASCRKAGRTCGNHRSCEHGSEAHTMRTSAPVVVVVRERPTVRSRRPCRRQRGGPHRYWSTCRGHPVRVRARRTGSGPTGWRGRRRGRFRSSTCR